MEGGSAELEYPLSTMDWNFHVSTPSENARVWTRRGMAWMYAFHHEEAIACFERAVKCAEVDGTECPMALWGIAHCSGKNYNGTSMKEMRPGKDGEYAQLALDATTRVNVTPVEQSIIRAELFRAVNADDDADRAYAAAMGEVFTKLVREQKDGADPDICALFAAAVMNQRPWSLYNFQDQNRVPSPASPTFLFGTTAALEAIRQGLAYHPGHPGLLHMLIHLSEMGQMGAGGPVESCQEDCDRLLATGQDLGHLLHMPAHIYCILGQWDKAVKANEMAVLADEKYVATNPSAARGQFYTLYRCHNRHMLCYAAMFSGGFRTAMRHAMALEDELHGIARDHHDVWNDFGNYLDAFLPTPLHVLVRFGRWQDILDIQAERYTTRKDANGQTEHVVACATLHYARALALAATGRTADSRREQALFRLELERPKLASRMLFNNTAINVLRVADAMTEGEVLYREGKIEEAFVQLRRAVALNDGRAGGDPAGDVGRVMDLTRNADGLVYDEPWGWMQPVRHALGALLLEQGQVEEAAQVYRQDLGMSSELIPCPHPDNVWSLHGLHECLSLQAKAGDTHAAQELPLVTARLERASLTADQPIKASCACKLSAFR